MISRFLLPYDSVRHELKEAIPNRWYGEPHQRGEFSSARMAACAEVSEKLPVCLVHSFLLLAPPLPPTIRYIVYYIPLISVYYRKKKALLNCVFSKKRDE